MLKLNGNMADFPIPSFFSWENWDWGVGTWSSSMPSASSDSENMDLNLCLVPYQFCVPHTLISLNEANCSWYTRVRMKENSICENVQYIWHGIGRVFSKVRYFVAHPFADWNDQSEWEKLIIWERETTEAMSLCRWESLVHSLGISTDSSS